MYDIRDYNETEEDIGQRFERHIIEREMYVVNLSKSRIIILAGVLFFLISSAFLSGLLLGRNASKPATYAEKPSKIENTQRVVQASIQEGTPVIREEEEVESVAVREESDEKIVKEESPSFNVDFGSSKLLEELESGEIAIEKRLEKDLKAVVSTKKETTTNQEIPKKETVAQEDSTTLVIKSDIVGKKLYFIQVAVTPDKSLAERERDFLKRSLPKAYYVEGVINGETMYKLKAGRYHSYDEAEKALAKIKRIPAYKDSYIYTDTDA